MFVDNVDECCVMLTSRMQGGFPEQILDPLFHWIVSLKGNSTLKEVPFILISPSLVTIE